jgi:hypothetical protein
MTLEELMSLRQGELVVFIKVDERIRDFHNHQVGDSMVFIDIDEATQIVNFMRNSTHISHFSYEICHYIERKIKIERENKLISLGI